MLYPALELGQPGNPAVPDRYTDASTLICPRSRRLFLQVSLQAVVVQFGLMDQGVGSGKGAVRWQSEEPYLPVTASLGRNFDAVRIKNYLPGKPGQAIASAS